MKVLVSWINRFVCRGSACWLISGYPQFATWPHETGTTFKWCARPRSAASGISDHQVKRRVRHPLAHAVHHGRRPRLGEWRVQAVEGTRSDSCGRPT